MVKQNNNKQHQSVKLELPTKTDYISLIRQFVGGIAQKAGFNPIDIEKIELAIDEACSNVVQHAYKFESNKLYTIEISIKNATLEVTITDEGDSFNYKESEIVEGDIEKHFSELKIGGLGIFLMQQVMDEIKYERSDKNINVLHMVKYLQEKAG